MYNRNAAGGSLAIVTAIVFAAWPLRAQDFSVNGELKVRNDAAIGQDALIERNLGIGASSPVARVQINQTGTGIGVFVGDRTPFGQALFETNLTTPATHAFFAESGNRVFSVVAGGDGFFKGTLDVGGDTSISGLTLLRGNAIIGGAAQINGGLSVSSTTGGLLGRGLATHLPNATLNVVGSVAIYEKAQIAGTLFLGLPPPPPAGIAERGDTSNTKLRVWGNVAITGNQTIKGNQTLEGSQTFTGDQAIIGNQSLSGTQTFGMKMRQMINLFDTTYGIGVQDSGFYSRTDFDFFWYRHGSHDNGFGNAGGGGSKLMQLDRDGNLLVSSSVVTPVLQITGGSDVAEPFTMSRQDIPKGSVVIIDEENTGHLKLSDRAYDRRAAGIVSGANGITPGISLSQQGVLEGGQNVALSGRVYVLADASTGAIKPGDLLTTSNTPGHAMKVNDHARAQGAVIGKAMSAMKEGKGMVLAIVTLQ